MTTFELDILLHYYGHADDHPHMASPPPIWRETINAFKESGLLSERDADKVSDQLYFLTERGRVYIEAVLAVPLPIQRWVMPEPGLWLDQAFHLQRQPEF